MDLNDADKHSDEEIVDQTSSSEENLTDGSEELLDRDVRTREESDLCIFCLMRDNDEFKLGKFYTLKDDGLEREIRAHLYCLFFASGLCQNGTMEEGVQGFLGKDILKEVNRARRLRCTYCKKIGASVGCGIKKCKVSYHFPCGKDNQSIFRFYDRYESFCPKHLPVQMYPEEEEPLNTSLIDCPVCLDNVPSQSSFDVLKTPCCHNTYVHRDCIQRQALSSGMYFFRCPICNNQNEFKEEMLSFGIHVPERDAAWERDEGAYQELYQRHSKCDIGNCMCPSGRAYSKKSGKWQIILCDFCGSVGCHVECGRLERPTQDWACTHCRAMLSSDSINPSKALRFESTPCKKKGRIRSSMKLKGKSPRAGIKNKKVKKSKSTVLTPVDNDSPSTSREGISDDVWSKKKKTKKSKQNLKSNKEKLPPTLKRAGSSPVKRTVNQSSKAPDLSPIAHNFQVKKMSKSKKLVKLKGHASMKHSTYAKTVKKLATKCKSGQSKEKVGKLKTGAQFASSHHKIHLPSSSSNQSGKKLAVSDGTASTSSGTSQLGQEGQTPVPKRAFFKSQFQHGLQSTSVYDTPIVFTRRALATVTQKTLPLLPLVRLCKLAYSRGGGIKKFTAVAWKRALLQTTQDYQTKKQGEPTDIGKAVQGRREQTGVRRMSMRSRPHQKTGQAPRKGLDEGTVRPTRSVVNSKQLIEAMLKESARSHLEAILRGEKEVDLYAYLCHQDRLGGGYKPGIHPGTSCSNIKGRDHNYTKGTDCPVNRDAGISSQSNNDRTLSDTSSNVTVYDLIKDQETVSTDGSHSEVTFPSVSSPFSVPSPSPSSSSSPSSSPSVENASVQSRRERAGSCSSNAIPTDICLGEGGENNHNKSEIYLTDERARVVSEVIETSSNNSENQDSTNQSQIAEKDEPTVGGKSLEDVVAKRMTRLHSSSKTNSPVCTDRTDDATEMIPKTSDTMEMRHDANMLKLKECSKNFNHLDESGSRPAASKTRRALMRSKKDQMTAENEETEASVITVEKDANPGNDPAKIQQEGMITPTKMIGEQTIRMEDNRSSESQQSSSHRSNTESPAVDHKKSESNVLVAMKEIRAEQHVPIPVMPKMEPCYVLKNQEDGHTSSPQFTDSICGTGVIEASGGKAKVQPSSESNSPSLRSERRKCRGSAVSEREKKLTRRISMNARGKSSSLSKTAPKSSDQTVGDTKLKSMKTLNDYFKVAVRETKSKIKVTSEECPVQGSTSEDKASKSLEVKSVADDGEKGDQNDEKESAVDVNSCQKETQTPPPTEEVMPLSSLISIDECLDERDIEFSSVPVESPLGEPSADALSSSLTTVESNGSDHQIHRVTTRQMVSSLKISDTNSYARDNVPHTPSPQRGSFRTNDINPQYSWPLIAKRRIGNLERASTSDDIAPLRGIHPIKLKTRTNLLFRNDHELRKETDKLKSQPSGPYSSSPRQIEQDKVDDIFLVSQTDKSLPKPELACDSEISEQKSSNMEAQNDDGKLALSRKRPNPDKTVSESGAQARRSKRLKRDHSAKDPNQSTSVVDETNPDDIFLPGNRNGLLRTLNSNGPTSSVALSGRQRGDVSDGFYKKSEGTPQKRILLQRSLSLCKIVPPKFVTAEYQTEKRACVSESKLKRSPSPQRKISKRQLVMQ
ncbi:uncharacterized protein [Apostichopus japonicus]|uniref:uncharacterized protein n=1 Tax=Stichopus japonicus TaxID=307972 RepID=UPI003AB8B4AC